jgi:hypothetical protein
MWGAQKFNKMLQHVFFDQIVDVVSSSRSDVCEAPSCLKLELGNLMVQELDEHGDQVGVDNSLNWWRVFD